MQPTLFSIIVPVYNEEEGLPELITRLLEVFPHLDGQAEVIFVDDGSADRSGELLRDAHQRDPRFKVLSLSRNFGHQVAITAGLDAAAGDAVIVMDADLQDPPDLLPDLIARWRQGYEVVYAVRGNRSGETFFKRATASIFYRMFQRLTHLDAPSDSGDFRLLDRRAVEAFKQLRERNRYVRGMFTWIGFKQTGVRYDRASRFAGQTKYSLTKMLRFAADGLLSFSIAPLRLVLILGFVLSGVSFLLGIAAIVAKLSDFFVIPGWASILVAVSFLSGVQLIVLGTVGEYVARIYDEVKQRPLYLVRESRGFTQVAPSPEQGTPNGEAVASSDSTLAKGRPHE